jgi:hypothetical protein
VAIRWRRGRAQSARHVIANLLPADLQTLLGEKHGRVPRLDRLAADVGTGWSAVMLYLVARAPEGASAEAHHLEIVQDPVVPGVWMVGDTVFPGQSTLATAIGGARTAAAVATALGLRDTHRS